MVYLANKAEVIYRLLLTSGRASSSNRGGSGWHLDRLFRSRYSRNLDDIFLSRVYRCTLQTVARDSPRLIRGRNNFILGPFVSSALPPPTLRPYAFFAGRTACIPHEIRRNLGYLSQGLNNFITKLIYSLNVSRALYQRSAQRNMSSCAKTVAFIFRDEDCVDIR